MTNEKKQEFTLRITQANKSELVVILYELFFYYIEEAKKVLEEKNTEEFKANLTCAHDCLNELIGSLHMEQNLAHAIMHVYLFVSGRIGMAKGSLQTEPLFDADRLMHKLYETYKEDAKTDTSEPVMNHTQTVYAGLTYGRNTLTENREDGSLSRGFLA